MAEYTTPTTKLEAVNNGLKALGFPRVNTLEGTIGRDPAAVLAAIDEEVRSLCRRGFWFSRRDVMLVPDESGFLVLPPNTLTIREPSLECRFPWSKWEWQEDRPSMRRGKVFSIMRQSYVYTKQFPVMIYEALTFEDLPDEARDYTWTYAALDLNRSNVRSDDVKKDLEPLLARAWQSLMDAELVNSNHRFI